MCFFYISRTGNTKCLAEAISEMLKGPIINVADFPETSAADDFDLLILGTPAMGLQPVPEMRNFVKRLPVGQGKKTILFCTCAINQGFTLKTLEKELTKKGYDVILSVSKRVLKLDKSDCSDVTDKVRMVLEK